MIAELTTLPAPEWSFIKKISCLQVPTTSEYVGYLETLGALQAVLLLACGLVYLLQGWKVFKILVVVNAAVLGVLAGAQLGGMLGGRNMPLFGAIACALLFAALAWPLMKFAVSIMGGLVGSFLGFGLWRYITDATGRVDLNQYAWTGALIGLLTLGLLAFVIFRQVIVIFTSVQGAVLAVSGIVSVLLKYPSIHEELAEALNTNNRLLPLLIAVPAVIGFAFQQVALGKKRKKKSGGDMVM
ncbi:MAG: hypothetical protein SVT52_09435 [Planctomycetota bacterium]|nr:hypothetical protein [Planctomycetota bacterium]